MSSKIKNSAPVNGADNEQTGQDTLPPVTVSMKKLTEGVSTLFMGIVQMLEALEPHVAQRLVDIAVQNGTNAMAGANDMAGALDTDGVVETSDGIPTPNADTINPDGNESGKEDEGVKAEVTNTGDVPSDNAVPADGADMASGVKQDESPSAAITEDDITKIIVRKIKQDRSNNEKIGAILRTYGVSKVSDLSASKYEAFLTDVSQL